MRVSASLSATVFPQDDASTDSEVRGFNHCGYQRLSYAKDLSDLKIRAGSLLREIPNQSRMKKIIHCIENVAKDIKELD